MTDALVLSAGRQLVALADALAEATVVCEFGQRPELRARYGPTGRWKARQDAVAHFAQLGNAVDLHSPALFNDHVAWAKALLHEQGIGAADLDHRLACMADVIRAQLPAAVVGPAVEMIDGARAALPAMPSTTVSLIDDERPLAALARSYMRTLLGGYRQAAARLVFDAADRGEPVGRLYLHVFQPALREVGRLWQTNRINVAQEHFCSASTQVVMAQLLPLAITEQRRGRRVVVVCVGGELHDLGARMVADFFEMDGWDAFFCGADTPQAAVGQTVVERAADVLAVSATMGHRLHAVRDLVERVRAHPRCARLRILVGGHPFTVDPALWRTVGADGSAADAEAAVESANRWLTSAGSSA